MVVKTEKHGSVRRRVLNCSNGSLSLVLYRHIVQGSFSHHCGGVSFSLNRFYTVFALSSGSALGTAFNGVLLLPSRFWDAEDRIVLDYISRPFGLPLHVLGNASPRRGPWALM